MYAYIEDNVPGMSTKFSDYIGLIVLSKTSPESFWAYIYVLLMKIKKFTHILKFKLWKLLHIKYVHKNIHQ